MSGITSLPESRGMLDSNAEPLRPPVASRHCQSLPSLRETLSGPRPDSFPPLAPSLCPQSTQLQAAPIPRSYPIDCTKYRLHTTQIQTQHTPSIQPFQPQQTLSHTDSIPAAFSENKRQSFLISLHAAPCLLRQSHPSLRSEAQKYEQDPWPFEQMINNGGLAVVMKGHGDTHDFEECLASITRSSASVEKWVRAYYGTDRQQERSNKLPDRMPTLDECCQMIDTQERLVANLYHIKDTIEKHQYAIANQRGRERNSKGVSGYDDDLSMSGNDMNRGHRGSKGKKPRGQASPTNQCHACNRTETPEWRRGPDGARTLCNACGLHYAKLARKETMR